MASITLQKLQRESAKKSYPAFKAGQTVRVHERIREGDKERTQIFEGLIIQTNGQAAGKTITVRKIISGIGVEKIFSIYSNVILKIELVKEAKTRRSKIFFMRERSGKSARLKEKFLTEKDLQEMASYSQASDEDIEEAVEAAQQEEAEQEASVETAEMKEEVKTESNEEVKAEQVEDVSKEPEIQAESNEEEPKA